jgi:glutathione S-transferase
MLTIYTYDWVPPPPRGFVRDLRLRWACEEAGVPYRVEGVPFEGRTEAGHLERQPFAQVPFIEDGGVRLFESGACLLHIAEKSDVLMPGGGDAQGRAETLEWTIAALNSVELVSVPWWFIGITGGLTAEGKNPLEGWLTSRLGRVEAVLAARDWLAAGRFTVADLLMADVLRVKKVRAVLPPVLEAYVARVTDRPAFRKAYADQMAHFAQGDEARAKG